ncbi:MAG: hypothetical protein ACLP59_34520 [Bryobacteraceae bacterium]
MTAPPLEFEVVQPVTVRQIPPKPKLKKTQIPKFIYAVVLLVLRTFCYDLGWDRFAIKISEHKFGLFPELRRWQVDKWAAQFQRQNLFPHASESELRERAKELVLGYLI